jgi:hypothetical protein
LFCFLPSFAHTLFLVVSNNLTQLIHDEILFIARLHFLMNFSVVVLLLFLVNNVCVAGSDSNFIDYLEYHDHVSDTVRRVNVFQHPHPRNQAYEHCSKFQLKDDHCSYLAMVVEDIYDTFMSLEHIPRNKQFNTSTEIPYTIGSIPLTVAPDNKQVSLLVMSSPAVSVQVQDFCDLHDIMGGFCALLLEKAYEIFDNQHPVISAPLHTRSIQSIEHQMQGSHLNASSTMKVLIHTHPCAGKSTFVREYHRKYREFDLDDIDDYTSFPIRDRAGHLLSRSAHAALLGGGGRADSPPGTLPGVIHVWVFPPIHSIYRNIISRQIERGSSCEDMMHIWANPRNVMRMRALARFSNIPEVSGGVDGDASVFPEFPSFEAALDAVLVARKRILMI